MSNRANRRKEKRELEPKRRFPEFRDAGKWEERKLGDFLLKKPDYGVNAPAVPYSDDLPAYLRITDISNEGYYLCDQKVSVKIEAKDENYLSEGDIVLARTGASVGKSYKYRKEDGNLVFAGFLIRIRPDPQKLDSTFLFNFLSTRQYWDWVSVNSARSGQPGINGNEYATLSVPVPSNKQKGNGLPEQQKIADCLTSIDDRITAETQKLDALKAHKKGLMQQLFPAEGKTQPKRRFPEFCDAGEWIRKSGDEITIKITKGSSPNWQGFSYKSQGVLFITSENVRDGFLDVSNPKYLPEKFYEKQKSSQLSHGDILINIVGASIGRSC
ncbi:MAG: restriction endonuclease subunit S, partial [Cyanobacteria bacterium J06633_1]